MKVLNLQKAKPFSSNHLDAMVAKYGNNFKVKFGDKNVPVIVKRRADNGMYRISVSYFQQVDMKYPTLNLSFYQDTAHIDFVHKNGDYGLSGSYLVKLAIALSQFLGVSKITLTDAATVFEKESKCHMQISPFLLLKKSTTFYGQFGFKPRVSHDTNTSYENDNERLQVLCERVEYLQAIKVKKILTFLKQVEMVLKKTKNSNDIFMFTILHDFRTGVSRAVMYGDSEDKEYNEVPQVLETVNNIQLALDKYSSMTIQEMMQKCSCRDYKQLYCFFQELPSVIIVKKKQLFNEYERIFDELMHIFMNSEYVLDLTQSIETSTCFIKNVKSK